jgi:hypothetical protein
MPAAYARPENPDPYQEYFYPDRVNEVWLPIESKNSFNQFLGAGIRIRQKKIIEDVGCFVADAYKTAFKKCYGSYEPGAEEKEDYGPLSDEGGRVFIYNMNTRNKEPDLGKVVDRYPAGAFMELFTSDYNRTVHKLHLLQTGDWLGPNTRVIFYDFSVYNFNLGIYAVCKITFEIAPNGAWINTFNVDVLRQRHILPLGDRSPEDLALLVGEILLVLLVLYYFLEEVTEFIGLAHIRPDSHIIYPYIKLDYFLDTWNCLDLANLGLIVVAMGMRILTWGAAQTEPVYIGLPEEATVDNFSDYSAVAANIRWYRTLTALNAVLSWFKAVKYISIIPYITLFMQTVSMSEKNCSSFFAIMACTIFGFMLSFQSAFGEQLSYFRSLNQCFAFLLRALLGDTSAKVVYDTQPVVGSMLVILFVVVIVFLLMNLFRAIMVSSVSDAKKAKDSLGKQDPWVKTLDKFKEAAQHLNRKFQLDVRFRQTVPGLYSRMLARKKAQTEVEHLRDLEVKERERRLIAHQRHDPVGGADMGRRKKNKSKSQEAEALAIEDDVSSDESEPDLGPLRTKQQIKEVKLSGLAEDGQAIDPDTGDITDLFGKPLQPELEPSSQDLVLKASEHVVNGIVEHAESMRDVLNNDMDVARQVLQGLGNVLDVLKNRARNLEAHQGELIRSAS